MTLSTEPLKPAVILVADRTLAARYKALFEGIFATMQTTHIPQFFMKSFIAPREPVDSSGRACTAPLGLRRMESALLNYTSLEPEDIVCTTPEALLRLLGPWVKIVAFSSSDPLGFGMSNTTTKSFWKGRLYTAHWTESLLCYLKRQKQKYDFKIVAGGAGFWQFAASPQAAERLGIDVVFNGYFENKGPQLFSSILNGQNHDSSVHQPATAAENIQPIKNASMLGIIELSRGCGRGCRFCTMAKQKAEHLSTDTIISDLQTNLSAGLKSVVSASEDFFRYGATGLKPDFQKLCGLLNEMRKLDGLSFMQLDHANITSVAQLSIDQLKEIRNLLSWKAKTDYLWVNLGMESANGHLVAENCPGKIAPFTAEDWPQLILDVADRLSNAGFFPVFSIVLGLPGETPNDIAATLKLVKKLAEKPVVIFPVFFEPVTVKDIQSRIGFNLEKITPAYLELYTTCYEINFKRVPKLFWDNQRAAGVSLTKRTAMQLLGKLEVQLWRNNFKRLTKKLKATQNTEELKPCTEVI